MLHCVVEIHDDVNKLFFVCTFLVIVYLVFELNTSNLSAKDHLCLRALQEIRQCDILNSFLSL